MMKLITLVLIPNYVMGKILLPAHDDDVILFNNMMRNLLNTCRNEFGTIGMWGNQPSFLKDGEVDVVLSDDDILDETQFQNIKSLVIFLEDFFHFPPLIEASEIGFLRYGLKFVFVFDRSGYWKHQLIDLITFIRGYDTIMENTVFYYCTVVNERKIEILTANSYADFAPANWVKILDLYVKDLFRKSHLRIYKTQYTFLDHTTDSKFCDNFFFDRTKNLFGYTISVYCEFQVGNVNDFDVELKKPVNHLITKDTTTNEIVELLGEECGNYSLWLMKSLNISINLFIEFWASSDNYIVKVHLISKDLTLRPYSQSVFEESHKLYFSYPIKYFHDIVVTRNRGLMSPLEKMFEFYGLVTIIATTIILSVTFLVIYQSNNHSISFALFDCLRLIINYRICTRMYNDNMRVFFFVIFLYFLIIQATFSGHLATFLTKPIYRKNIATLEDLKDPHYEFIYVPLRLHDSFTDELLVDKFLSIDTYFLDDHFDTYWLTPESDIALIDYEEKLNPLILKYNLQKSKDYLKFDFSTLMMRGSWGLRERVNLVIMRWTESYILNHWHENANQLITKKFEIIQDNAENYYRPVEFGDLCFAFIFLAFGLISAVLCFVIELFYRIILVVGRKIIQFQFLTFKIIIFELQSLVEYFFEIYAKD